MNAMEWVQSLAEYSLGRMVGAPSPLRKTNSGPQRATALVLLAKYPGAGKSKTRLAAQLRPFCASDDAVQAIIATFVRAATLDLLQRFAAATASQGGGFECFLTYAPPTEEARSWFASLLQEGRVEDRWRLQPVLSSSSAASSSLGDILCDAGQRARAARGCARVSFLGVDCPDLPLEALLAAASASSAPGVAAVCPASDGGYTLLALPEGADERLCFSDVRWSAGDTCLSQLQALTRAGLTSAVLETHSDVDELPDLRALWARLAGEPDSTSQCPHTRAMLAALATSAPAVLCG